MLGERLKDILNEFSKYDNSLEGCSSDDVKNSEIFQNLGLLNSFLGLANDVHSLYEKYKCNSF